MYLVLFCFELVVDYGIIDMLNNHENLKLYVNRSEYISVKEME